mmetsp:Transcript_73827/g.228196  ORF Transcript_73827/g.228196 Transcript_73827/m.228196 type:complete len:216 (-) Transcript_73827:374-1021(-)
MSVSDVERLQVSKCHRRQRQDDQRKPLQPHVEFAHDPASTKCCDGGVELAQDNVQRRGYTVGKRQVPKRGCQRKEKCSRKAVQDLPPVEGPLQALEAVRVEGQAAGNQHAAHVADQAHGGGIDDGGAQSLLEDERPTGIGEDVDQHQCVGRDHLHVARERPPLLLAGRAQQRLARRARRALLLLLRAAPPRGRVGPRVPVLPARRRNTLRLQAED